MDTTETAWLADGISLQTFAMNIITLGVTRNSVPQFLGDNSQIAYRRRALWTPKVADERPWAPAMWVRASNSDGVIPTTHIDKMAAIYSNLRALRGLFWKPNGAPITLTKKWYELGPTIISVDAQACLVGGLEPTFTGPYKCALIADLNLPDPYFYGEEDTQTVPKQTTPWTSWTGLGDTATQRVTLEFVGPLVNPTLTLSDPIPDIWISLGTNIATGDKITVDCDLYTAVRDSDEANMIGVVTNSGSRSWMLVQPGENTMQLIADSGSGHVVVRYRPAYL